MERARLHVPEVIRTFMRVRGVSQEQIGFALGLTQRQVSRRLNVPGAISQEELAGLAAIFGVPPSSFYRPLPDALADLFRAAPPVVTEGATAAAESANEAKGASLSLPSTYRTGVNRPAASPARGILGRLQSRPAA